MSRWHTLDGVPDLPEHAFQETKIGMRSRMTLEGGGGGGQTTATNYQTNLPKYAQPYYEDMMDRAHEMSLGDYTPYTGDRVAGFTPNQQSVMDSIYGMQMPSEFDMATAGALGAMNTASNLTADQTAGLSMVGYQPQTISAANWYQPQNVSAMTGYQPERVDAMTGYQPQNVSARSSYDTGPSYQAERVTARSNYDPMMTGTRDVIAQQHGAMTTADDYANNSQYEATTFDPGYTADEMLARQFSPEEAAYYMSPYQQNVTDIEKRQAVSDALQKANLNAYNAEAASAFGGSRHGIVDALHSKDTMQLLDDIQKKGLQDAYESGRSQFNADRQAQMDAQAQTEAWRQAQADFGLRAQDMSEGSRQFLESINQFGAGLSQADADRLLQSSMANADRSLQAGITNADRALQSDVANADRAFQSYVQDADRALNADQFNSQQGLAAYMQDADRRLQSYVQDADRDFAAQQFNTSTGLQNFIQNADRALNAGQFNTTTGLQNFIQNADRTLNADQFNTTTGLQNFIQNADRWQQAITGDADRNLQAATTGIQSLLQGAGILGDLGTAQSNVEQAQLKLQQATSAEEQALAQRELDQAYQDFVNQRDYQRQQLAYFNALLRGIPVPVQQETIQYQAAPGIGGQLTGAGLASLGAQMFQQQ